MADIARLAGVSTSTVSRALAGNKLVNAQTRQRIQALAESLNYTINVGAQNLRRGHNRCVALVLPHGTPRRHLSDPFFLALVGALADALSARGLDVLLWRVDAEHADEVARLVDAGRAAGALMIGSWPHPQQLEALAERGLPVVAWGASQDGQRLCRVGGDDHEGGLLATRHLLAQGCRRILFIGDAALPHVMLRLHGYRQALREHGLASEPALELAAPFNVDRARPLIERRLTDPDAPPVDAVFACSDMLALAAIGVLAASGRRVPADVAVVGYDDVELARLAHPALTTVRQPLGRAADAMVDALAALIDGRTARSVRLPTELVVRASTRATPGP